MQMGVPETVFGIYFNLGFNLDFATLKWSDLILIWKMKSTEKLSQVLLGAKCGSFNRWRLSSSSASSDWDCG